MGGGTFGAETSALSPFTLHREDLLLQLLLDAAQRRKVVHLEHVVPRGRGADAVQLPPGGRFLEGASHLRREAGEEGRPLAAAGAGGRCRPSLGRSTGRARTPMA